MVITSYYRGSSDRLSGVTFDTEKKTFKTWVLKANEWCHEYRKGNTLYSKANDDFKAPGDLQYYHQYKSELDTKVVELQRLGFVEDTTMVLTFKKEGGRCQEK